MRDDWESLLSRNDKGSYAKGVRNVMLILRNDPRWADRLRFNTLTVNVELDGAPLTDSDTLHARGVIERNYHLSIGDDLARQCIRLAAEFSPYDPRRTYLTGLKWDGVPRLESLAERHFGAQQALYPRYIKAFFLGAVRRVCEPGCKHDTMLILQGKQGDGKSSWFAEIFGEWFTDSEIQLGSRDGALVLAGVWGVELSEVDKHLAGKAEDSVVKAALTSRIDTFRRPYASTPESVPRSSVFGGTTNKRGIFRDHTGSRRFHLLEVLRRIPIDLVRAERDQLWAEALHLYLAGEGASYWLTPEEEEAREILAERYQRSDPWADVLRTYLSRAANLTTVNSRKHGMRYVVSANVLLGDALGIERKDWRREGVQLGETMERLGAVVDSARFERVTGGEKVSVVERAFFLPSSWAPNTGLLADGAVAPAVEDTDTVPATEPPPSRSDSFDRPF